MAYQIGIIDDEPLIRERLRNLLSDHPAFTITFEASNGQDAIEAIKKNELNAIFIDIKMPKVNGFQVLDQIDTSDLYVIFITAFDTYAIKAFEYEAFDYLLKPIIEQRFIKTLHRLKHELINGKSKETISIRTNRVTVKLLLSDITHLEAADNYVVFHTYSKSYRTRNTLSDQVNILSSKGFIRVHRSYAINQTCVHSLTHIYKGEYLIQLKSGRIIPSSKAYNQAVQELLK